MRPGGDTLRAKPPGGWPMASDPEAGGQHTAIKRDNQCSPRCSEAPLRRRSWGAPKQVPPLFGRRAADMAEDRPWGRGLADPTLDTERLRILGLSCGKIPWEIRACRARSTSGFGHGIKERHAADLGITGMGAKHLRQLEEERRRPSVIIGAPHGDFLRTQRDGVKLPCVDIHGPENVDPSVEQEQGTHRERPSRPVYPPVLFITLRYSRGILSLFLESHESKVCSSGLRFLEVTRLRTPV